MTPGGFGVAVQADADANAESLERFEHGTIEQGAIGLQGDIHLCRHLGVQRLDELGQPFRPCEQWLPPVQDDVHIGKAVPLGVLGDAFHGRVGCRPAHALRQATPPLIRHFVHIAVRTGQITATMDLQDKLPIWDRFEAGRPNLCYVEVEQRPGSGMPRHMNQPARSSGSLRPPRHACTSNMSGRWVANAIWRGDDGSWCSASVRPIQASGCGSAAPAI